jgi:hypothetical protein
MNPQITYTPQQQMGYGGFSVPCRVGNWAEDEYLQALKTQEHFAKESVGMLTSQMLSSTLNSALAPVTLAPAPADGAIKFGDTIMLSAAQGGVVAFDTANRVDLAQEAYAVTRTGEANAVACKRTAWTVTPLAGGPKDGLLRIGMPFALSCTGADGRTLYLQSQRYTLHNQNYAGSGGSGSLAVVVPALSADTVWKVVVLDPSDLAQLESMNQPVPANTYVSLQHANTCSLLYTATDKFVKNKYNGEYLVSVLTDTSINKGVWGKRIGAAVGAGNHFAFTTASA